MNKKRICNMPTNTVPGKTASSPKIVVILSFIQHAFINQASLEKLIQQSTDL